MKVFVCLCLLFVTLGSTGCFIDFKISIDREKNKLPPPPAAPAPQPKEEKA